MINAGALTATSLIRNSPSDSRFERIRRAYSQYAGRDLQLNEHVYTSESESGFRNRAIGYMLRTVDILEGDPDLVLEDYFKQCSIGVDCRDVAIMAATLANGGVNPRTHRRLLGEPLVTQVLSVMTTCGMCDAAGDSVTAVGLPAKKWRSGRDYGGPARSDGACGLLAAVGFARQQRARRTGLRAALPRYGSAFHAGSA